MINMCFRRKQRNSQDQSDLVAWLQASGPSDADYDKDTYEYQKNRQKQSSSFGDDSSMTP